MRFINTFLEIRRIFDFNQWSNLLLFGACAVSVIEDGEGIHDGLLLVHAAGLVGEDGHKLSEVDGSRGFGHHLVEFLVARQTAHLVERGTDVVLRDNA